MYPLSLTSTASPMINLPHQSGIFVTIDEPTLICYNQPKSIVYIRVHSWCTSMGLDKWVMTWVHHHNVIEYFHCPKNPLCSTYLSVSPPLVLHFIFIFTFHKIFKYFRPWDFPWWLSGKESAYQCRRHRHDPRVGKIPGGGNGNPIQYSCLGNPTDRGAWRATVHEVAKGQIRLKWLNNKNKILDLMISFESNVQSGLFHKEEMQFKHTFRRRWRLFRCYSCFKTHTHKLNHLGRDQSLELFLPCTS